MSRKFPPVTWVGFDDLALPSDTSTIPENHLSVVDAFFGADDGGDLVVKCGYRSRDLAKLAERWGVVRTQWLPNRYLCHGAIIEVALRRGLPVRQVSPGFLEAFIAVSPRFVSQRIAEIEASGAARLDIQPVPFDAGAQQEA